MIFDMLKKRGIVYIPFIMVMILIFGLIINSNLIGKNFEAYLGAEKKTDRDQLDIAEEFVLKLGAYKDEYYRNIDLGVIEDEFTFLNYIKKNNLKLFNGNFYILDFVLGNKLNPNGYKILFYKDKRIDRGYYFYTKENGRNIKLNIARIFKI